MNFRRSLGLRSLLRHRFARLLREAGCGPLGASSAIVTSSAATAMAAAPTRPLLSHFTSQRVILNRPGRLRVFFETRRRGCAFVDVRLDHDPLHPAEEAAL